MNFLVKCSPTVSNRHLPPETSNNPYVEGIKATPTQEQPSIMRRNTAISISKGIAIILMVMGHANCPGQLNTFIYEFHMPLFFISAGFFFSTRYINEEATFVKRRIKGLYLPFVKWSVAFLLLHNLFFKLGLLNEQYGNSAGGVTHPYQWHTMQQRLWNIVTAMSSYDEFLAGAFWFFRALLVASILHLVLFKMFAFLATKTGRESQPTTIGALVCMTTLGLAAWQTGEGLRITTIVQGGYRDIMGTFFFGCGFIFSQHKETYKATWWNTVLLFAVTLLFSLHASSCMDFRPDIWRCLKLPVPAICGTLFVYNISLYIDRKEGVAKRLLTYCGDNTLSVLVLHLLSFKLVSLLKIWCYGLDIAHIGSHTVVHVNESSDGFWMLYTIVGVGVPLVLTYVYRKAAAHISSAIK